MHTPVNGRRLSASDIILIATLVMVLVTSVAASALASPTVLNSARDCAAAERDAQALRGEALLGARYRGVLDGYISAAKHACAKGDFAAASSAFAMVRAMASSE